MEKGYFRSLIERFNLGTSYSISLEEFRKGAPNTNVGVDGKPEVKKYVFGDLVTRDNYVSMLINSFAVSRGRPRMQYAYLDWLKTNTGFNFYKTITNYERAGGWNCLTNIEQATIKNAFAKVGEHSKKTDIDKTGKPSESYRLDEAIDHQLEAVLFFNKEKLVRPVFSRRELRNMSKEDLFTAIGKLIHAENKSD
jgi:hypothetical protein